MFKHETEHTAAEALTDEQLELVSGGDLTPDAGGNIPTCPPWFPGHPLVLSHRAEGAKTMTNIDMNVERELTADELELVSGGDYVGHAAKIEAPAPISVGDVLG